MAPRTGSSFLSEALKATGLAGIPEEYYNADTIEALLETHSCKDVTALHAKILESGTTSNGVFGTQVSTGGALDLLIESLGDLPEGSGKPEEAKQRIVEHIHASFPNLTYIHLTRRNKVRQAVSWWKAVQTNQWVLRQEDSKASNKGLEYNYAAIDTLVQQAVMRESGWQAFYDTVARYGTVARYEKAACNPIVVVYEDLISNFESTMRNVLDGLNLNHVSIPKEVPAIRKQADDLSEEWVYRYVEEKQKGEQYKGWNTEYS